MTRPRDSSRRTSSAHARMVWRSPESSGWTSSTAPRMTSPVVPSMEITSPSLTTRPESATVKRLLAASIRSVSTPQTQGAPIPRAITAAWLVLPPWEVRMPSAATMPWRSSGVVSQRTRIQGLPASAKASASAEEKTAAPTAAPGEALRPLAMVSYSALGSNCGCRS